MMRSIILLLSILPSLSFAGGVEGVVRDESGPIPFATVYLESHEKGEVTDVNGKFILENLKPGTYTLMVRALGYSPGHILLEVDDNSTTEVEVVLKKDLINLDQLVVSGTRSEVPVFEAPVIVSQIDASLFERSQGVTLSEGLAFSPGLRLENNCQNCSFTQLRMNGLEGAYSQILINSRPVFSSLMGVYGLDLIPANMIDRVEVVRGGGSALYGGNAIAGTVNIITKDPIDNSFQVGVNQAYVAMESSDRSVTLNGSIVSDDLKTGLSIYGFNRNREAWDANGDGFSELTSIENSTFGFDAYYKPSERTRLAVNGFAIDEFRRGGNDFDLPPHQTDITEQLDHRILGGAVSFEAFSQDYKHKFSTYVSGQHTNRNSYYGGGGRVIGNENELTDEDVLAINAYGSSEDVAMVGGLQYVFDLNTRWNFTLGSEYQYNEVSDRMPGYNRRIDQTIGTMGNYAQVEAKPLENLTLLVGGRYDIITIEGIYDLAEDRFDNDRRLGVFVPRASVMYDLTSNIKLRGSYAQGYRAPQAFDEDLHIETVGGAALFTRLDPTLVTETSDSFTASINYSETSETWQTNLVAEAFYTALSNPFITANQIQLPSGVAVVTKRNGDGAIVQGVNLEANLAYNQKWVLNAGFTLQSAEYAGEEEIWSPEVPNDANADSLISTTNILRTPHTYGYWSLTYNPDFRWEFSYSGVYTGKMEVPHVIDPETEFTIIEETPSFLEHNLKLSRNFPLGSSKTSLEVFFGVQNVFNAYQDDFDTGPDRDAGYIYGPNRPRTVFFGLKVGME